MKTGEKRNIDFAVDLDFRSILSNPILDIAARFWSDDRYHAFQVTYRSMRRIDDLVDHRKGTGEKITENEAEEFRRMIFDWFDSLRKEEQSDPYQEELLEVIDKFKISLTPWQRLCEAMVYDLQNDGYATVDAFIEYSEGAAVAPASIFMHLCGLVETESGFTAPVYDSHEKARPLALFSYFVHTMRDFQKDQIAHLNCFPSDLLFEHGITDERLRQMALAGESDDSLRYLFSDYKKIADRFRSEARILIDSLSGQLEERYSLSLEIIYALYLQIFEGVNPDSGLFTTEALQPRPDKIQQRIDRTVNEFRHSKK